ncbi:MAG: hypothetical protein MUE49_02485 [Rhodospirillales bacterium]|nr:hypothetical protein [Rhodospirillales bacterium]
MEPPRRCRHRSGAAIAAGRLRDGTVTVIRQGQPARRTGAVIAAFAIAALLALGLWWVLSRPVTVVEAPSARLPCLSYAPYRDGQTPFDGNLVVPRAQIEEDLRILAAHTSCVRTYSVDQGLDVVPEIAETLGLKVLLGAWVGRETAKNEVELARAITLANRHPETIRAVIVGNEVLLRREQPPDRLAALIADVRARVPVPVTYADVWEFWLKHPEIAATVDFITVHMLPYWEDEPIAVDRAIVHVLAIWDEVARAFPGRTIFIGEAGWPSAGRMREGARPGIVEQATFVRGLLAAAAERGIDLNLIEAFDQPWKRKMEGTVGGHWGLFDAARLTKFAMTGPVDGNPRWRLQAAAAVTLALIPMVFLIRCCPPMAFIAALAVAAAAQLASAAIVVAMVESFDASLTLVDWLVAKIRVVVSLAAFALVAYAVLSPSRPAAVPSAVLLAAMAGRQLPQVSSVAAFALGAVRLITLIAVAATTLALLFDPRYRDFPVAAFLVPALAFLLLAVLRPAPAGDDAREDVLLAGVLAIGGIALIVREGIDNIQAVAFSGIAVALAIAVGLDQRARWSAGGADDGKGRAAAGSLSARSSDSSTATDPAPAP